jgi:hypothetical protein
LLELVKKPKSSERERSEKNGEEKIVESGRSCKTPNIHVQEPGNRKKYIALGRGGLSEGCLIASAITDWPGPNDWKRYDLGSKGGWEITQASKSDLLMELDQKLDSVTVTKILDGTLKILEPENL